ncbi:hypothetical protein [Candidatus Xianfuyuplasma coldseepsis]|uniref:[FeFe] hydrogenase H-cluster radical SAM maturase HydG n=1 Tax=Candidatus Xianfuyuplasma coldseepsis TaxID=2782163 RepID=A0A7L7KNY7_9MOLU|nr:hypothetical protein [Xianfuyuplasma coldseepsis]QMS84245.1 hypothetical protein G4Z02_00310 [Xianfuyuplasma coldseepsis]
MEWLDHKLIYDTLEKGQNPTTDEVESILDKAYKREQLSLLEVAKLLNAADENQIKNIFNIAGKIKDEIYGKRVVTFAPLYVSNKCVNNCKYCGYRRDNKFDRKKK